MEFGAPAPEAHTYMYATAGTVSATPSCSYFVSLILTRLLLRTLLSTSFSSSSSFPSPSLSCVASRLITVWVCLLLGNDEAQSLLHRTHIYCLTAHK